MGVFDFYKNAKPRRFVKGVDSYPELVKEIRKGNEFVEGRFPEAVISLGWILIKPDSGFSPLIYDHLIVIGVPLWSAKDLNWLDSQAQKLKESGEKVAIFNIDDFPTPVAVESIIPGVPPFTRTPIWAEYKNGYLVASHEGLVNLQPR